MNINVNYDHCGRTLFRVDYVLLGCETVFTKLYIASSFDDVYRQIKGVKEIKKIEVIENDISIGIFPLKEDD